MRSAVEMRALTEAAILAWNDRRFDDFYEVYDPDITHHGADGKDRHGVDELRALYDGVLSICPDLTITLLRVAADPDTGMLASLQQERGTTTNGEPFGFEGMIFSRLGDDGRVRETWEQIRPLGG